MENLLVTVGLLAVPVGFAWWQIRQPTRACRRGIRRLESYANHPANRTRRDQSPKGDQS